MQADIEMVRKWTSEQQARAIQAAISQVQTQRNLAQVLGVTQAAVSQWLTGTKKISVWHALRIEDRLGIPRAQLRPDVFT